MCSASAAKCSTPCIRSHRLRSATIAAKADSPRRQPPQVPPNCATPGWRCPADEEGSGDHARSLPPLSSPPPSAPPRSLDRLNGYRPLHGHGAHFAVVSPGEGNMQPILDYESDERRWRTWFAWYPLLINGQSVWLRTVHRRPEYCEIAGVTERSWVYRLPRDGGRSHAREQ